MVRPCGARGFVNLADAVLHQCIQPLIGACCAPGHPECYVVRDANGVTVAWLFCRDDSQRYSVGASKLSSEEARRIGKAISRLPEFMMPRQGFCPHGSGPRLRTDRPYHVALWDEIYALCRLNSLPFNSTGE